MKKMKKILRRIKRIDNNIFKAMPERLFSHPACFFVPCTFQKTLLWYIIKSVWAHNRFALMERSGKGMNCKDTEKKIPYFLQDELDGSKLEEFVEHVATCPECKEELSIQFLVAEGLERLESGNNFNLQKELLMKLENAQHRISVHRMLWYTLMCLEAAVAAAIIIALCVVFRL